MLKTIKRSFLAVVLAVVTLFSLTSCIITGGPTTTDPTLDAQAALNEFTEQVTFANTAEVTTSFNLPAAGKKGNYQIPITWTSNNTAVIAVTDLVDGGQVSATHKKASVTRPAFDSEDVTVTLTAEFSLTYTKNDGTSATLKATKTYNFTVLKETSEIAGGTLADIKADAAKFYFVDNEVKPGTSSAKELEFPVEFDATVTVVLGADGAGQFAVSDGTAGIYVYSNKTAVKVGDKVHVKGSITVYYGTLQVGANIEVTPATFADQTIEFKSATPTSINAMSTADGMYGGQTLKVSGTLLFGKYNNGSSDSFWLEDAQTGSQIELYYKSFTAAEKEALQAYAGKYVEMDVVTYDTYSSSAPNDHRVFALPSTVKEATAPEVTDAEKVAAAIAKIEAYGFNNTYYNGEAFAFPTIEVAEGVNVAWSLEPAALLVDGKFVITEAGTATIKAVVTCGEEKQETAIEINVAAELAVITIEEALELADGADVCVEAEVSEINTPWSDQYGNISVTLKDETGTLYVYRLATKVEVGAIIKVTGKMGSYNGAKQIAAGATAEIIKAAPVEVTIEEAKALEDGTRVKIKGTVKSIDTPWSDQYGNITITLEDETGSFQCYRLATKVEVGNSITVTGEVGSYKETKQIAAGATAVINTTPETPETPEQPEQPETPETPAGEKTVELTVESLGLESQKYAAGTKEVNGVSFEFIQIGNYGDGIQMRDKDGKTSKLWSTTAFGAGIIKIELTYSTTKDVSHSNENAVIFSFGTAADNLTYSTKLSTTAGVKTYTITPNATTYTFLSIEHDLGYTFYWDSIKIYYAEGTSTPEQPEVPAHEHTKCPECDKCTAADCDGKAEDKCQGHTTEPEQPETPETPAGEKTVELTVESLGLESQKYAAGTKEVNGVSFEFIQIGNYGDGIQMRDKDGKTSKLWSTTAFGAGIIKIELTYSTTKDVSHSNENAVIFSFGTAADNLTYSTKLSTTAGVKTYTITPNATTYTFLSIEHDLGYTFYWDSIKIYYAEGTSTPEQPETPETPEVPETPEQPEQPETPEVPETPAEQVTLTKVTNVNMLTDGAKILLTYKDEFTVGAHDGSKFASVAFAATQTTINADQKVIVLVKSGEYWALKVDDNYISYTGSSNNVLLSDEINASSQWTISVDEEGKLIITNVATPERLLQYNASNPRFVCYKATQINPEAYVIN